jgi:hypothetical protein
VSIIWGVGVIQKDIPADFIPDIKKWLEWAEKQLKLEEKRLAKGAQS